MPGSTGPVAGKSDLASAIVVEAVVVDGLVVGVSWPVWVVHAAKMLMAATSRMFLSLPCLMMMKAGPMTFVRQEDSRLVIPIEARWKMGGGYSVGVEASSDTSLKGFLSYVDCWAGFDKYQLRRQVDSRPNQGRWLRRVC